MREKLIPYNNSRVQMLSQGLLFIFGRKLSKDLTRWEIGRGDFLLKSIIKNIRKVR